MRTSLIYKLLAASTVLALQSGPAAVAPSVDACCVQAAVAQQPELAGRNLRQQAGNNADLSITLRDVAVNEAPTDITLSNTVLLQSQGSNAVVATLSTTDVDSTSYTYSLVGGTGDTDNSLFTLSGNTLQAANASTMLAGLYSIRLSTTDDGDASYEKAVTIVVLDDIAPTFDQTPTASNPTAGGFTLSGSVSEAGHVYYVVVPDGASAPSATRVIAGQTASGGIAHASGSQVLSSAPYDFSFSLTGLPASTMYDVYVASRDSAGNTTASAVKVDANTAAAGTAPSLSAFGSNPVFIGGMAGSVDLFANVSANTNDSGQTFRSLTLTVSNVSDSGEFMNVGGRNISLAANSSGTVSGIGSYSVTRVGNTVTLQVSGISASNIQLAGLVDGLRYGNSNASVSAGARTVTLTGVSDSGSSNNITALSLTSTVNVLASNSALYVTSGNDTGADAVFGGSIQDDVNDGGGLSLREALYWANNIAGVNRIVLQTDVSLASSIITPTQTLLIDGQSFTLNGGGYAGFEITTPLITLAIQNLTLMNFATDYNVSTGGIIGLSYYASDVNLRFYNVDMSGNRDTAMGNGMIDLYNISSGTYNIDFDRVHIHDNTQLGGFNDSGVIKLFVSGTDQTLFLSLTNSAIHNNVGTPQDPSTLGVSGLALIGNRSDPTTTYLSLSNTTITGQDTGLMFQFVNNATSWTASVRNSLISGNGIDVVAYTPPGQATGSYNLFGSHNILGGSVSVVSDSDPRLAANATNAINRGSPFYATGDTDVRGLDRTRQGTIDLGAYESQFAAGTAPQLDLNGSNTGTDYSASVSSGLSNGVAITDALASISQTDGDSRIWTMTLALSGVQDTGSEALVLPLPALLAAHAAGIDVMNDGQTLTLTGGATTEAFQTALHAMQYVNVASSPTNGARTIAVTVNDDASTTATSTLNIAANNAPVLATPIGPQVVAQNAALNYTVPAHTFSDPDGDTLTLSATLADGSVLPAWLSFNPATNTFLGTPGNSDVGSLSIQVTATNTTSNSVSTTFSLTVTNVNDAPVVALPIPPHGVLQDQLLSFIVPTGTFSDPDGDPLVLSARLANDAALPAWLTFNAATSTFSGTPGNADVGNISIKITATDPSNASVSTTFQLFVLNINDAPEVATPIPAQSVVQESMLNFVVPSGTFSDPDGDFLTLSATLADGSALPAWLSFNTATRTFSGTPSHTDVGSLSIRVTASDGDASVSTVFILSVTHANNAPVVATPIPDQSVEQGRPLSFTVPAATFIDPDGDLLILSATLADGSPLPTWLSFSPAVQTFSGTPGANDVGNLSIRVTAIDPENAFVSTSFSLQVIDSVAPSVLAVVLPESGRYVAGDTLDFTVTFSEPVTVDTTQGQPRLAIALDAGGPAYAEYTSGSGSEQLVLRYTVAAGQRARDGILLAGSLDLNAATIRDQAGNDAEVALQGVGATDGIVIGAAVATAPVPVPVDSPLGLALLAGAMAWLGVRRMQAQRR